MATTAEYDTWKATPTPENLGKVVATMAPLINSEVQRFTGPKPLLRSKAKVLTIKAIRSYDPASEAQLHSWVVTQLQPLARYGQQLRVVHAPEAMIRQAAEINRHSNELAGELGRTPSDIELADKIGIPPARIQKIRAAVRPSMSEGSISQDLGDEQEGTNLPGVSTTNRLPVVEEAVYDSLGPRDRAIYDFKVGRNGKPQLSNQEIARRLGVTPALISQLSQQIAIKIRDEHHRGIL